MSSKPHHEAEQNEIRKERDGTLVFNPRGFSIIWGNDKRYWTMPDKGTQGAAELVQVCWLELTASTQESLSPGKYSISFNITVKQGAFGWKDCPIFMMAKIGKKGKYKWDKIELSDQPTDKKTTIPANHQFVIDVPAATTEDRKLYFGLYEVWTGKWKGGLLIHEAEVKKL